MDNLSSAYSLVLILLIGILIGAGITVTVFLIASNVVPKSKGFGYELERDSSGRIANAREIVR